MVEVFLSVCNVSACEAEGLPTLIHVFDVKEGGGVCCFHFARCYLGIYILSPSVGDQWLITYGGF